MTARELAVRTLMTHEKEKTYIDLSLKEALSKSDLSGQDRAFTTELVYGTVKMKRTLDYIAESFSSIRLKKLTPAILQILRTGLYQLFYMDRVPVSAAVNESVKLAKKLGNPRAAGFVNAVLRAADRNREGIRFPQKGTAEYLGTFYAYPDELAAHWVELFDYEEAEKLMAASNRSPGVTLRVNPLKTTREALQEKLKADGIEAACGALSPDALLVSGSGNLAAHEGFLNGEFTIQDEASQMAALAMGAKPGMKIIDVCAAPGGKSTAMAAKMANEGRVYSFDLHPHKITLIEKNAERLGIKNLEARVQDARVLREEFVGKMDGVLADVPCSGLGIIRKKPDIKWQKPLEGLKELPTIQAEILETASRYVRPGGTLVYSTCTLEPSENGGVVEAFLAAHPEFQPVSLKELFPNKPSAESGQVTLMPHEDGTDGFFIAKMEKKA